MEGSSIVSRARTAFHSAAAKAERVLTDIKSDFSTLDHLELKEQLPKVSVDHLAVRSQEDSESKDSGSSLQQNSAFVTGDIIPPASVLKQLSIAIVTGKDHGSVKDLLNLSRSSSPVKERASLSLSAMKSLMCREKEEKFRLEHRDNQALYFLESILDAEGLTPIRKIGCFMETWPNSMVLAREIHGAPPESFLAKIAVIMGSFKTLQKMALFWCKVVAELRKLWLENQYVPGIPEDELLDLNCCLLYQQLQVMNCCVSRKKRRIVAIDLLESLEREDFCYPDGPDFPRNASSSSSALYARLNTGELVLRLGANHPADCLTMLETGEPVYAPLTQEAPLLTEDLIREHEEFVLRTGSVGAGCSQLLSDMQAFKAANPGCILEDFVRWHSPPDWSKIESCNLADDTASEGSSRGRLSSRMQKEGNLWRELWETAKPVPSVRQAPLFDEDLAVEGILSGLEVISPSSLFEQLFLSVLGVGFVIAEATLSANDNTSRLFFECKDYVVATCQEYSWNEKIEDLCQVYESVEAMLVRPESFTKIDPKESEEPKRRLMGLSNVFSKKNRSQRKAGSKEQRLPEEKSMSRQSFRSFFDTKSSLFARKPPKAEKAATAPEMSSFSSDDNEWMVV